MSKVHLGAVGWSDCGLQDLAFERTGDHDGYTTT